MIARPDGGARVAVNASERSSDDLPTVVLGGVFHWNRLLFLLGVVSLAGLAVFAGGVRGVPFVDWTGVDWVAVPAIVLGSLAALAWYAWWLLAYGAWLTDSGLVVHIRATTHHYPYEDLAEIRYAVGVRGVREHLILRTHPEVGFRRATLLFPYFSNGRDLVKGLVQNAMARSRRVVIDPYLLETFGWPPYDVVSDDALLDLPAHGVASQTVSREQRLPVFYRKKKANAAFLALFTVPLAYWYVDLARWAVGGVFNPVTTYWFDGPLEMLLGLGWIVGMGFWIPFALSSIALQLGTRVGLTEEGIWARGPIGRARLIPWSEVGGVYRTTAYVGPSWWGITTGGRPHRLNPFFHFSGRYVGLSGFLLANEGEIIPALLANVMAANPAADIDPDLLTIYVASAPHDA